MHGKKGKESCSVEWMVDWYCNTSQRFEFPTSRQRSIGSQSVWSSKSIWTEAMSLKNPEQKKG